MAPDAMWNNRKVFELHRFLVLPFIHCMMLGSKYHLLSASFLVCKMERVGLSQKGMGTFQ